jgi:phospholipid/cholesterol/gamma-HCH transport system ATP-binding protein
VVAAGSIADMLACEHPWVRSYFHGKRSRAARPQAEQGS